MTHAEVAVPADLRRAYRERLLPAAGRRRRAVVALLVVLALLVVDRKSVV